MFILLSREPTESGQGQGAKAKAPVPEVSREEQMALEAGQGASHPGDLNKKMIVKSTAHSFTYTMLSDQTCIPLTSMNTCLHHDVDMPHSQINTIYAPLNLHICECPQTLAYICAMGIHPPKQPLIHQTTVHVGKCLGYVCIASIPPQGMGQTLLSVLTQVYRFSPVDMG